MDFAVMEKEWTVRQVRQVRNEIAAELFKREYEKANRPAHFINPLVLKLYDIRKLEDKERRKRGTL